MVKIIKWGFYVGLFLLLSSCVEKKNNLNRQKASLQNLSNDTDTMKVEPMQNLDACVLPELLTRVPYVNGQLTTENKLLVYSAESNALPYEYKSIQRYLENIEGAEYAILKHSNFSLFPSGSTLTNNIIEDISTIEEQTVLMNKEQNKVYGKWIELHKYVDKKTDNYRISIYVPKLDAEELSAWTKQMKSKSILKASSKEEQENIAQFCLDAIVVAANIKYKFNYLIKEVAPKDALNDYKYVCTAIESRKYFQATPSSLESYMGSAIRVELELNPIWGEQKAEGVYSLPQILQLNPNALIYSSSSDRKEIIVTKQERAQLVINEDNPSSHYTKSDVQSFYFTKMKND